ncbi:7-cyano-7-deazaguanine synthase QueC [Verminephrobacter eiseniae]|uniref:7-cyano-7-deazaguanine synthase QueC n=1 Tax=Verminephrobacter eiseniae TaxID=364317 RepID=UPI00223742CE|nr:7-cyano-7-deazaguanine synthase QueC [Verminephrobacter eiseniae]MCW5239032.1 7-cyano-7-deazaguanine synthase QueC [Verminephrobacter eiseniae]
MRAGHALVLFSGGQDSTTCLAWALTRFAQVETIGFDYGQRHHVELQARQTVLAAIRSRFAQWRERLGADHMIDLSVLGRISDTALTRDSAIQLSAAGLPNTFVPGRNLLFFNLAAAVGYRRGLHTLVGGMCETDFSGYPDCRDDSLKALQVAVSLGLGQRFTFETPLMWLDKAATWELARSLGGQALVELIVHDSHTCYHGVRGVLHAWGHGCGTCPACVLRQTGYDRWQARPVAVP